MLNSLIISKTKLNPIVENLEGYPFIGKERMEEINTQNQKLDFYKIKYKSPNGIIVGYLIVPKLIFGVTQFPCIIYNRGGSRYYGQITDRMVFAKLSQIASWGYVVIASQYSGNDGSQGVDEFCGKDMLDIICLKDVLAEIEQANINNIHMIGRSRGGMATYLASTMVDWIQRAVIEAGVSNLATNVNDRYDLVEFWKPYLDLTNPKIQYQRSVVNFIDRVNKNTKFLIIQGRNDDKVSLSQSVDIAELFTINRIENTLLVTDDDHGLRKSRKMVNALTKVFLAS